MAAVPSTSVLTIGQLARQSGLSTHTLRFYEGAGVLRPAGRAGNGHRQFLADDVRWLEFVLRLKGTGMPLAEIRQYAELRALGPSTAPARLALLQVHRGRLRIAMAELVDSAAALDAKIRSYQDAPAPARIHRPQESS